MDEENLLNNENEMTEEDVLKNFEKAGKIASDVASEAKKLVRPGESILEMAETIESLIIKQNAKPGFPACISVNEYAAHYTPEFNDQSVIGDKDVVKIDIGVSVEGCIGDVAFTLDFSEENGKMVEASEAALNAAISCIKPGVRTGEVGAAVEKEVVSRGFKPIENLTGHSIRPYMLHAGLSIPNIGLNGGEIIEEGMFIAIEPFCTNGAGRISETSQSEIFELFGFGGVRMSLSRKLLVHIAQNYQTLPFAERWLYKDFPGVVMTRAALKELANAGCLLAHPALREVGKGLVSQTEHTIVVEKDGARVLTK